MCDGECKCKIETSGDVDEQKPVVDRVSLGMWRSGHNSFGMCLTVENAQGKIIYRADMSMEDFANMIAGGTTIKVVREHLNCE